MQTISTLAELDAKLAECDRAAETSDAAMREVFASFQMAPPADLPAEPLSEEYTRYQLKLYEQLAGKPYSVENEATVFDWEAAARRPFPYFTECTTVTADQYTAIGALLRRLHLPRGARILEFGPGWGNTTLALALLGFQVTAIDIEPRFCQLIQRRSEMHGVHVETVCADFNWAESVESPYDAAIFFECFHHAADHRRLLRALRRALMPEAPILMTGEPITPDFPVPWGLRMDGQSLWSIRKHGWFELGFHENYFIEVLASEGWLAEKHRSGDTPFADVWEARQFVGQMIEYPAADPRIVVPTAERDAQGIALRGVSEQWGFFGPYATLPAGRWVGRVVLGQNERRAGEVTLDVAAEDDHHVLASREIKLSALPPEANCLELEFELPKATRLVELRLFCRVSCDLSVARIEFAPRG